MAESNAAMVANRAVGNSTATPKGSSAPGSGHACWVGAGKQLWRWRSRVWLSLHLAQPVRVRAAKQLTYPAAIAIMRAAALA